MLAAPDAAAAGGSAGASFTGGRSWVAMLTLGTTTAATGGDAGSRRRVSVPPMLRA